MVSSFFELLLPDGKVKPFVRFAIGLFILISILNPTLNFLYSEKDLKIDLWTYKEDLIKEEEILKSGEKINRHIISQGDEVIKQKLEGQISAVAMLVEGVQEVETKASLANNGELSSLHILVRPEVLVLDDETNKIGVFSSAGKYEEGKKQAIAAKILSVVKNMYSLDSTNIKIEFEGG